MLQSHADFVRSSNGAKGASAEISERLFPASLTLVLALLLVSMQPLSYVGGGYDDWHYLEAARCIAEFGYCVPHSHWAARLPLVLPTGLALALFGEGRDTLWLIPLIYGSAALLLFVAIIQRSFGRLEALLAGTMLALTPMVGGGLLALNVTVVELFFIVAAAYAGQSCFLTGQARWAAASGALLGLAILSRGSAIALLPIIAIGFCLAPNLLWRHLVCLVLGLAAVVAAEMFVDYIAAGDALHSWRLALGHTNVASTELSRTAAASGSPLFNRHIIAGWSRGMDIQIHWSVDGALNLLADPHIGYTLIASLLLLLVVPHTRDRTVSTAPFLLLGVACLYYGALTYVLAVDPKARMFAPVAAAAAAMAGIVGAAIWRDGGRPLILFLLALLLLNGVFQTTGKFDFAQIEETAAKWASQAPAEMAIDETARRVLTLRPEVRRLPALPAPGARRVLTLGAWPCRAPAPVWRLTRFKEFGINDPPVFATLRAEGLFLPRFVPLRLCEFRRG